MILTLKIRMQIGILKYPFEWERIRNSFRNLKELNEDLAEQLLLQTDNTETQAHYVWLSRDFSKEYFLMPYKEVFSSFSNDKQALLYALARQEKLISSQRRFLLLMR